MYLNALQPLDPSVLLSPPIEPQSFYNFKHLIFDIFGALLRNSQRPAVSGNINIAANRTLFIPLLYQIL
jgi:hypothetical protein